MFTKTFHLLKNEGHLIRGCLTAGLTDLRNANYASNRGRFYSGFFHLSNGLERLLKVTLILDHMADNRLEVPPSRKIKELGHDLETLADRVLSPQRASSCGPPQKGELEWKILRFFSSFARKTRYHNLDALTCPTELVDPLSEWNDVLEEVVANDVPNRTIQRVREDAKLASMLLSDYSTVIQWGLDGRALTLESGSELIGVMELGQKYAVVRVFRLLSTLAEVFVEASDRAQSESLRISASEMSIPYMADFVDFLRVDEQYFKSKKRWP